MQVDGTGTPPPQPDGGTVTVSLTVGLMCTGTYQVGSPVVMTLQCTTPAGR